MFISMNTFLSSPRRGRTGNPGAAERRGQHLEVHAAAAELPTAGANWGPSTTGGTQREKTWGFHG